MNSKPLVYFETSVVLAHLKKEPHRQEACVAAFRDAETGLTQAITSVWTMVEVVKLPGIGLLPKEVDHQIEAFFRSPWLRLVTVDPRIATKARHLVHEYGIKKPHDAVHLATALLYRAEAFFTFDSDHLLPLDGKIEGLRIMEPKGQLRLDL